MISPVSFGSTYKAIATTVFGNPKYNSYDQVYEMDKFLSENIIQNYSINKHVSITSTSKNYQKTGEAIYTINVPKKLDNEFETFCANKGIDFIKK